jgi:membrane protease YdiL (CAAX protease family)
VLALGVIVTPMFNAARGSLLIPMLFHFQINGPAWPEAQPWENYLFAIVAVLIVVVNRRTMLHRNTAVTEVLMPVEERDPSAAPVTAR